MTLPYERALAVKAARNLLKALLDPKKTPRVPKSVRLYAARCLKHYPTDFDMNRAKEKDPTTWGNKREDVS